MQKVFAIGLFSSGRAPHCNPVQEPLPTTTTPRGFEPLRAEPNGFRVHLLSRSDTVSDAFTA